MMTLVHLPFPLMLGAEMTKLDDWTLSCLPNQRVLDLLEGRPSRHYRWRQGPHFTCGQQAGREEKEEGRVYAALFLLQGRNRRFRYLSGSVCIGIRCQRRKEQTAGKALDKAKLWNMGWKNVWPTLEREGPWHEAVPSEKDKEKGFL